MNRTLLAALLALTFNAIPLQAQTPWIHVEGDEHEADASHVKVNLPLSVGEGDNRKEGDTVHAQVRLTVLDALFSGEG